jgi:hypothetical protein
MVDAREQLQAMRVGLVYIAAFGLDEGESIGALLRHSAHLHRVP